MGGSWHRIIFGFGGGGQKWVLGAFPKVGFGGDQKFPWFSPKVSIQFVYLTFAMGLCNYLMVP